MRIVAALALLFVLAACGGGADGDTTAPAPSSTEPTTTADPAAPTVAEPKGEPAPAALSNFRCEKNADGVWNAGGMLSNAGKDTVNYQVTVYIGPIGSGPAMTQRFSDIAAKTSAPFSMPNITATGADGPCHVQVLSTQG